MYTWMILQDITRYLWGCRLWHLWIHVDTFNISIFRRLVKYDKIDKIYDTTHSSWMYLKTDSLEALEARDAVDSLFKKEDWTMPTADMSLGRWQPGICRFLDTNSRRTVSPVITSKSWNHKNEPVNFMMVVISPRIPLSIHGCTAVFKCMPAPLWAEQLHIEWMYMVAFQRTSP